MKYLVNGQEWEPGEESAAQVSRLPDRLVVRANGATNTALVVRAASATYVSYRGRGYKVEQAHRRRSHTAADSNGEARAPMPGQIVELSCKPGEKVEAGDRLMVLEAMKMQQPILAPETGTVRSVAVKKGDQVAEGQILAVVEAE